MGNKLAPRIIPEGTPPTFKTEVAIALNEPPRRVGSGRPHPCGRYQRAASDS
jgi:hypothetical protein